MRSILLALLALALLATAAHGQVCVQLAGPTVYTTAPVYSWTSPPVYYYSVPATYTYSAPVAVPVYGAAPFAVVPRRVLRRPWRYGMVW